MGNKYSICESCLNRGESTWSICKEFWKVFEDNNKLLVAWYIKTNNELFSDNPFKGDTFKYTPKDVLYLYCYDKLGCYWYLDGMGLNNIPFIDIANPAKKNKPTFHLAVPRGIIFMTGNMKERKYYIPEIIVESILPHSDDFLHGPKDKKSLESFIEACKLTIIMQDIWWIEQ